ncbi:hypothetical protein [Streptomyces sp. NPDC053367]|uniref:hypothetical protein n=1 Tax=Streptomyces sp. NPDC053367 TaxID=3365700 RepID=UPI0037D3B21E
MVGGLGGAAALLTAVALLLGKSPVDWFADSGTPSTTTSTPAEPSSSAAHTTPPAAIAAFGTSSVTIQQPTTHDGEQVEVEQCQEFRGTARPADGFTLWLAGHTEADPRYALYTEAAVSPATGRWTRRPPRRRAGRPEPPPSPCVIQATPATSSWTLPNSAP